MDNDKFLQDLSFFTLQRDGDKLEEDILQMMNNCHILEDLNIPAANFRNFTSQARKLYKDNPFHSFHHAASVCQMLSLFILYTDLQTLLTPKEKFMLMVVALCHDLDHPGLSNTFQINSKSELALKYQNKSVLENHHLDCCLSLINQSENQLLNAFTTEERNALKAQISTLILGTDMANHFNILKQFEPYAHDFKWDNNEHKTFLLVLLMKTADISNEARPFSVSKEWAHALVKEYFAQSDLEKEKQLPLTPFMERKNVVLPTTQMNFIDTFLMPLYTLMEMAIPQIKAFSDVVRDNRKKWAMVQDNEQPLVNYL